MIGAGQGACQEPTVFRFRTTQVDTPPVRPLPKSDSEIGWTAEGLFLAEPSDFGTAAPPGVRPERGPG